MQSDATKADVLPEIPREALEQCALYRRMLASEDFNAVLRAFYTRKLSELADLPAVSDQEKRRTVLTAEWQLLIEIPKDMARYVEKMEATMEERKRQIEARQKGQHETGVD